jgi:hypothetical protein
VLAALERLARAEGYDFPLDPRDELSPEVEALLTAPEVPIPLLGTLRMAAHVRMAQAALLFDQADEEGAETALREVLSVGILLIEEGTTLIEVYIGRIMSEEALDALSQLYTAQGREVEAQNISQRRAVISAGYEGISAARQQMGVSPREVARQLREAVADPDLPRGHKWEYLVSVVFWENCGSPAGVLVGPGSETRALITQLESELVQYPTDAERFSVVVNSMERIHERSGAFGSDWLDEVGFRMSTLTAILAVPVEFSATLLGNSRLDACFWTLEPF